MASYIISNDFLAFVTWKSKLKSFSGILQQFDN